MLERQEEHFIGKIAQKAIIINDNQVLLVRDGRMSEEIWELPGGRLNVGEEARSGLARELKEELGVNFTIHEVVHMEQFKQGSEGTIAFMIAYQATMENPESVFEPDPTEVAELKWVSREGLETMVIFPEHRRALEVFYSQSPI